MFESGTCSKCQEGFTELGPAACYCHRCLGELSSVVKNLYSKVQFCVDHMNSMNILEEGVFTFPDGDAWTALDKLEPIE